MAEITAKMVKELREATGAGMLDCKKALAQTDGDMEAAIDFLREKGLAASVKKAGRIAAEGIVATLVENDTKAVILEVNSETDFVAKNEKFQMFVAAVAKQAMSSINENDMDAFLAEKAEFGTNTVAEELSSLVAIIGEKMTIRRFIKLQTSEGCIVSYNHGGGRIGVLVKAKTAVVNDTVKEALKNVCMQIAALKPSYISKDDITPEFLEKEKEIIKAQIENENTGKPDNIIEKMLVGRLNKELKEMTLLDQPYVKAVDKETVAGYLQQVGKEVGATITIEEFIRFETGEGLEKKEDDFAAEVAKQMEV